MVPCLFPPVTAVAAPYTLNVDFAPSEGTGRLKMARTLQAGSLYVDSVAASWTWALLNERGGSPAGRWGSVHHFDGPFRAHDGAAIAESGFKIVQSLRTRKKDVEIFHRDANASFDGPCLGVFYALHFLQLMTGCEFKPRVRRGVGRGGSYSYRGPPLRTNGYLYAGDRFVPVSW